MAALSSDTSVFREKEPYRRSFQLYPIKIDPNLGQFKRMDDGGEKPEKIVMLSRGY